MTDLILLKCPNCGSEKLRINIMNRFKKSHYFVVWCVKCEFAQKFNERKIYGFRMHKSDYFLDKWKEVVE